MLHQKKIHGLRVQHGLPKSFKKSKDIDQKHDPEVKNCVWFVSHLFLCSFEPTKGTTVLLSSGEVGGRKQQVTSGNKYRKK